MNILESLKRVVFSFMNIPYIPLELRECKEPMILHISDTPASYHPYIATLVHQLQPTFLIHTGDLVDNIKLESNPQLYDFYEKRVAAFLKQLEMSSLEKIYIVPGNHDNIETLQKYCKRSILVKEDTTLPFGNIIINLAHHPWSLSHKANYYLYGHNFNNIPNKTNQIYLNGLNKIHVILLDSNRVVSMDYPYGINQDRKMYPSKISIYEKGGK